MTDIRLLALDLDGTALRSDNTLSDTVKDALRYACDSGIEIVVASGRPYLSMPQEVLAIEGIRYVIASNGAAIYNHRGERIHASLLKENDVLRLLALTQPHDLIWEAFREDENCTDRRYYEDPVRYGCTPAYVGYVRSTRAVSDDMRGYIYQHRRTLDSVEFVSTDEALRESLRRQLTRALPNMYITSSSAHFVEFMDAEATKSAAVRWLCGRLQIRLQQTAAAGNADNDIDMITQAGFGAAVRNATPACLRAADVILPDNDSDGVAQMIRRLVR